MSARRATGFTLFEVLGVILVLTILLSVAIDFYINLTRQAERASENTREIRRASTLLDRVARDLEQTLLVRKPEEMDPLANPWIFLGEPRQGHEGSDRLKFVKRELAVGTEGPASDLAVVAYTLDPAENGRTFELRRWSSPVLPEGQDRSFPAVGDPESLLVADDVAYFSTRFLDEKGEWQPQWDSTLLVDSSELPTAVEIEVALADPRAADADLDDEEPVHYSRQVQLAVRPIDLDALLHPEDAKDAEGGEGEDGEEDKNDKLAGKTFADCVDLSQLPEDLRNTYLSRAAQTEYAPYAEAIEAAYPTAVNPGCRL